MRIKSLLSHRKAGIGFQSKDLIGRPVPASRELLLQWISNCILTLTCCI